jgi:hypothetical protein
LTGELSARADYRRAQESAMSDRIDDYLEGRIQRNALSRDEQAEADAAVRAIALSRELLAERSAPDVTSSVMSRIGDLEQGRRPWNITPRRLLKALWAPREVRVRPALAVLATAAVLALLWIETPLTPLRPQVDPSGAPQVFVQFRLQANDARRVQLAGSFTQWQPRYELHESASGFWTAMVPLSEGVHDYAFLVDGERWVADPYSAQVSDGFGATNSRVTLLVSESHS